MECLFRHGHRLGIYPIQKVEQLTFKFFFKTAAICTSQSKFILNGVQFLNNSTKLCIMMANDASLVI